MRLINKIRTVAELVQKAGNSKLYKELLDVQKEALDILEENRELKEGNRKKIKSDFDELP